MARGELTGKLRALLGAGAEVVVASDGAPVVAPRSADECALLLGTATSEGWRVRLAGGGSWMPPDAPVDFALSTSTLSHVTEVNPSDLVATVEAGASWDELRRTLGDHEVWIAHDAPGRARTLGSVAATGTAGPLRAGFGALRDQVLGLTLVSGDGRIVRAGGRVVKNVAGFDVAKLAAGSFGAFGVITSLHLRLRTVPRADTTLVTSGGRDELLHAALRLLEAGQAPAALELFSPRADGSATWTLAIRVLGTASEAEAARAAVVESARLDFSTTGGLDAAEFWRERLEGAADGVTTLRLAALPTGLDDALDLVAHHLDETVEDWISVTVPAGLIRWSGDADADRIALLRKAAAEREMPVTIERGPWELCRRIGHFGAYREGVARLTDRLRSAFDPAGVLAVPVSGAP